VLIVVREQQDVIHSAYKQYVRVGGPCSLKRYVHPPRRAAVRLPLFDFRFYEYHRLVRIYHELFGKDNVLVLPFELLRKDNAALASQVARHVGLSEPAIADAAKRNIALSGLAAMVKRPLNYFLLRSPMNPAGRSEQDWMLGLTNQAAKTVDRVLPRAVTSIPDTRMKAYLRRVVGDFYADSNRQLADITGLDLAAYKYKL